ncbi:hypothetical protein PNU79_10900 [Turicibacter sanguinis]|uniref:hypothetical protein n=1 Tax=Turicibacter sanguinis TaxID=154288 RepID=UPI0023303245|nr:hypothetical protein [Turicibacter sanguinis]MDB8542508.1 hypothetical protein [Turicibacter sanguinis]
MLEIIDFVIEEMENKLYSAECDLKEDNWIDEQDKWICESFIKDMKQRIKNAREWRAQVQNGIF